MTVTEVDTFIRKFNQLWQAGLTAHLDLDTHAGSAWVGLRVQLGHVAPGPLHQPVHQQQPFRKVSPSRERRRARRLAAREGNATTTTDAETATGISEEDCVQTTPMFVETEAQTDQINIAEEAIISVVENENVDANLKDNAEKADQEDAGKADKTFNCQICDFESSWERGLNVHMGIKHSNIEQLDGNDDVLEIENKYDNTEHYWIKGRIGVTYHTFLDANYLIDRSNLPAEEKRIEKEKLLEARKVAFGTSFRNFPPWNKWPP